MNDEELENLEDSEFGDYDDIDSLDDQSDYGDDSSSSDGQQSYNRQKQISKKEEAFNKQFDDSGDYNKNYFNDEAKRLEKQGEDYKKGQERSEKLSEKLSQREEKAKSELDKSNSDLQKAKDNYKSQKRGSDERKKAKEDYKNSKQVRDDAKKNYQTRRDKRKKADDLSKSFKDKQVGNKLAKLNNKVDKVRSKSEKILHPIRSGKKVLKSKAKEVTKKGVKSAGKASVKAAKTTGKAIVRGIEILIALAIKFWPVTLTIIAVLFLMLLTTVVGTAFIIDNEKENNQSSYSSIGTCDYNDVDFDSTTKVELINCSATKSNYEVLETITLEDYIAGVAIAEMGEDFEEEAIKAQLIAVRSYTLTRNIPEYGVGYDKEKNVIRMRACENDQVYWNYTKDIYRKNEGAVSKYSPEYKPASGEIPWKKALSAEKQKEYKNIVKSVLGEVAVDSGGSIVHTDYTDVQTQKFISLAKDNKGTDNGKYTAILMNVYPSISSVISSDCETYDVKEASGDYTQWKQKSKYSPWGGTYMNNGTIDKCGCLIVSYSILIAHSGTPTTIPNFNPGTFVEKLKTYSNPKTFTKNCLLSSTAHFSKIVPAYKGTTTDKLIPIKSSDTKAEAKRKIIETLKPYIEKDNYIILNQNSAHYIAIDNSGTIASGFTTIKIWDPAKTNTDLFDSYSNYKKNNKFRIVSIGDN